MAISRGIKYRGGAPSNPKKLGNTPITRGIVGCWPSWSELGKDGVADGSGQLYDISGFGSHATLEGSNNEPGYGASNAPALRTELKLAAVIDYDDVSGAKFVSTAIAPPNLLITGDVTMSIWVEFKATTFAQTPLCYGLDEDGEENNNLYLLFVSFSNLLAYSHEFGVSSQITLTSSNALSIGTAYHIVCVRQGLTVKVWVNGEVWIDGSFTSEQVPTGGTSAKLAISGIPSSISAVNDGAIAFPTIWNRALTRSETLSLYHRGSRWQMFETVPNIELLSSIERLGAKRSHRQFISNVGHGMG